MSALPGRFHDRDLASITRAEQIACIDGPRAIEVGHLLLGVLAEEPNAAVRTLISQGVSVRALEKRLGNEVDAPPEVEQRQPQTAPHRFETKAS